MLTLTPPLSHVESIARRTDELFAAYQQDIHRRTDRLFAGLMAFQWLLGIAFALWVSPLTWDGDVSSTHLHVWAAVVLGGVISLFPALLGWFRAGHTSTRHIIAVAQMLMGALLIHLTGGRIETHFHVFGSLAFLAFYRDWRVLVPATIVVALDHMLRGLFWPRVGVRRGGGQPVALARARGVGGVRRHLPRDGVPAQRRPRCTRRAERTATLEHEVRTRQEAETKARNATVRNDAILDVALDCVVVVDGGGHVVQFNPAAELTFGYSSTQAIGAHVAELMVPAAKREAYRVAFNHYVAAGNSAILNRRFELTASRNGGAEFPVEVAVAPISTVGAPLYACYMRDITERKRAEEALARRTQDLQQANAAERHNATQLANLVEELRVTQRKAESRHAREERVPRQHEPRAAHAAQRDHSLQRAAAGGSQGPARRWTRCPTCERIQSAGKHLLELINGILDLSKIEAGKMGLELEHFDVRTMIEELIDTVAPLVQKNRNTLKVHCTADTGMINGDLIKTRQILLNLLSNAGKFTSDGTVTIDVRRGT